VNVTLASTSVPEAAPSVGSRPSHRRYHEWNAD
jgi:hypothetical protein